MIFIRSTLFNIWFFGISFFIIMVLLLTIPMPRAVLNKGLKTWMRLIMGGLKVLVGLSYEVRGRENIPVGPALYSSKHQSAWDTGIFFLLLEDPAFVLKKELLSIPLYGWLLKKDKMVAINRDGGGMALRQLVRKSQEVIENGRQLVIFPEGTRSTPGFRLPYHPGVAAIYKKIGVSVIPVALNSGLFWGRRSFTKRPGKIIIEFLPSIVPGMEREAFISELESQVEKATNRLIAEGSVN